MLRARARVHSRNGRCKSSSSAGCSGSCDAWPAPPPRVPRRRARARVAQPRCREPGRRRGALLRMFLSACARDSRRRPSASRLSITTGRTACTCSSWTTRRTRRSTRTRCVEMGRLGELRRARLRCTHAHARTHVPAGVQRRLTGARGGGSHHGLHASTVAHQPPPSSLPRAACLWRTRRTRPRRISGSSTSREGSGPPPSQLPRCRAAAHLRSSSPTAARRTLLRSRSRSPVVLLQVLGRAVLHAASQAHAAAHILQVSERRPALAGGGPHDRHLRRGQQAQSLGGRQSDLRGLLLQRRCAAKCSSHPVPPPGNVS